MPPKNKKKNQTRITLEPVDEQSSPNTTGTGSAMPSAKVRFSGAATRGPNRRAPSDSRASQPSPRKSPHQSQMSNSSPASHPTSFMPQIHGSGKQKVISDSSDDSAAEVNRVGSDDGDSTGLPSMQEIINQPTSVPRSSQSVSTILRRTVLDDDDDDGGDSDDDLTIVPSSSLKRRRPPVIDLEDSDDDAPIVASSSSRRPRPKLIELDEDSDEQDVVSPVKRRKMSHAPSSSIKSQENDDPQPTPGRLRRANPTASSPTKKSRHKGHRSEKQKKMELLRRRRAGEKIDKLTSSESSSDDGGEKRGMYDTDSGDEFEVLKEFDDEEDEPEPEEATKQKLKAKDKEPSSRKKRKEKAAGNGDGEDEDEDEDSLDDFLDDDDAEDAPIGAPALDIPLEFTAQAHKPLRQQFPHVVEWLVHDRIDPAFERRDPVYANAWRKLDDEVRGLATSKFTSAAWKADFYRALKARPHLDAYELPGLAALAETCEACGRSGHPATWKIVFGGTPYHKDTLADVESDGSEEGDEDEEEEEEDGDTASVDTQGNSLPPTSKNWLVGVVCCSNAETAHSLIHWKHALKEWVEQRLENEGWLTPDQLRKRDKMKPKKRSRLADKIVDNWRENGTVDALYGDFKKNLEEARNKGTTGRSLRGKYSR
ncbi:hypothetical protein F4810DRAFT_458353 [Camillea tinctor]|nr:hypothetical protein F4810DRAFT_458353 [Camillea tinctor]